MSWYRPWTAMFLLTLITYGPLLFAMPSSSADPPSADALSAEPAVEIEFNEVEGWVHVEPGTYNSAVFSGWVSVHPEGYDPTVEGYEVRFSVRGEMDWGYSVSPWNLTFEPGGGTHGFYLLVKAPYGTLSTLEDHVHLGGTCVAEPGGQAFIIDEAAVTVKVDTYYRLDLVYDDEYRETFREPEVYSITIENLGNSAETFEVSILNRDEVEEDDLIVTISDPELTIPAHGEATIEIIVEAGPDTPIGLTGIRFQVDYSETIQEGASYGQAEYIYYRVKHFVRDPAFWAKLIVSVTILGILAGTSVYLLRKRKRRGAMEIDEGG